MRKILHSGIISFSIILLIQLFILAGLIFWLSEYSIYFVDSMAVLTAILLIYEINRPSEPSFKYAWIVIVTVLPVFGSLLYIYTHLNVITKKISKRTVEIENITRKYTVQNEEVLKELKENTEIAGLSSYLYKFAGCPSYKNTAVEYFPLGEDKFAKMKEEMEKATKFIFMEYFIIDSRSSMWKELEDILKRKAKEGVEVRVMYDAMGSLNMFSSDYCKELEKQGVKCRIFKRVTPILETYQNNRNHRKILVIDGHTAFTGGVNIADEYINVKNRFGHWKDTAVMLKGEGVVSFTAMFLRMWNLEVKEVESFDNYIESTSVEADGYVIPYCDSPIDDENIGERVYMDIINNATEYVHIMTPYLVISHEMRECMKYASKRGVDVRIIMPHIPDKKYALWLARSYYKKLIVAGVRIFEYTPGFSHAKVTVADNETAVVGTINYDYRSLYLNYECALYMHKVPEIENVEKDFTDTESKCMEITLEQYKKFNIFGRIYGMIIRFFAPLV